jgi:predicted methyltransferase
MRLMLAFALAATTLATPLFAKPADYAPAVTAPGRAPEDVALDAGRKPAEVLDFLGLKKGMTALDDMAGEGYYSEIMARVVGPKGRVIAWVPRQFLDEKTTARLTAVQSRTGNVAIDNQPFEDFLIKPRSLDFALFHLAYHDLYWQSDKFKIPKVNPDDSLKTLFAAMKPGGIVGVVDHVGPAGDTRTTVDKLHRIDPDVVKADFKRAGFVLVGESPLLHVAEDDHSKLVFDPTIRGKTDRFVLKFVKPK